jgi:ABC-type polysaccharide/polyol phosphate transport system ATPase subunit
MNAEILRLEDVSLWRNTQDEASYDIKKTILSFLEGKYKKPAKRLVLDQINLVLHAGDKLGIIGGNGSGKSTLLKLISGVLQPSQGKVRVKGQIAPLIELGAGFDPLLSVLDNIWLYGVLMGFSHGEMKSRSAAILEFAELQAFATAPLKTLSSGMVARLGFAIATDVHPDILILDEVLSVGDERFKHKSMARINSLWNEQTTVLVVSHDLQFIKTACQSALWLEQGKIRFFGSAEAAVDCYIKSLSL